MSLLFDSDPFTQTRRIWHEDPVDGSVTLETEFMVDSILADAKESYNQHDERSTWQDINRVATIPLPLYWELYNKGIVQDQRAFRAWLNDPDNRSFRTRPGKL